MTGLRVTGPAAGSERDSGAGLRVSGEVERGGFRLALDFTVAAGEVLGVLGPNGAGKTTLLRTLAGLGALSRGRIELAGTVLDDAERGLFVPPERRPVGLVFQNYRLFPHLTVRDNVAFAARARGARRQPARRRAEDWLQRSGLAEFAGRKPAELSGGQAQRVALARTLAADPDLLLLDEPLAALDARTRLEVRGELRRHLRAFGGPSLVVTHDPLEAMVLTDRLLVIEDGRVVQQGTPAEVARRPASQYVARLVGLNLYPGVLGADAAVALDDGGVLHAHGDGTGGQLGELGGQLGGQLGGTGGQLGELGGQPGGQLGGTGGELGEPGPPSRRVLVALRPSAISLHTERPRYASPRNVWPGTVTGVELLTDRVRVQVSGSPPALVDVTPDAVAELDLAAGSPVWLSAKATEIDCYPDPR
ncbi:MAG TPA: ABC transporter ATP-binding protein [Jatrophihabitans sp.]|uniref:ABC transporter ATP-binding protein n=1 Tax=Jatrophihabitans sp. TaxID=1932789 RepID=UPI002F071E5B